MVIEEGLCEDHLPTPEHAAPAPIWSHPSLPNGCEITPISEPQLSPDIGIELIDTCQEKNKDNFNKNWVKFPTEN